MPYRSLHEFPRDSSLVFYYLLTIKITSMAKKAQKTTTSKGTKLKIVNPNAAGIDIADTELQVCVPVDRCEDNNRRFGSFTCDIKEICKWLKECKIDTVAMETTGVYWIPLFLALQQCGIDVILANARDIKNIAEKKTDKSDAEWIMLLHSYGLLKSSYQPNNLARPVRSLIRHRNNLLHASSKAILHMQKAIEQMNIKLTNVISDIVGKSGTAIVEAILKGERNPETLAQLADGHCRRSKEDIARSLEGTWDEDHLFELMQSYEHYKFIQSQINDCDHKIKELLEVYVAVLDVDACRSELIKSNKRLNKKNAVSFDVEQYANTFWGVNVMAIPGMNYGSILQLLGELGHDFISKFDSPEKFCKWCNIVPNNRISGGKLLSSRLPKRKNPVGQIFRVCANTLKSAKNPLGLYFRRIKSRSGHMQAIVATAHKMIRIFYTMVKYKCPYDEKKVGLDEKTMLKKRIIATQKALDRLNAKLSATTY